jgi:hypothetical protein
MPVLTLPFDGPWDPAVLLAPPIPELWPANVRLGPLGDLAMVVSKAVPARPDQAVVTPGGVDGATGAVQRTRRDYSGPVRILGSSPEGLLLGDVLVPTVGSAPCLLLREHHRGLAFSDGFIALRPELRWAGKWLWACLSSTTGQVVRAAALKGSTLPRLIAGALVSLPVPVPLDVPGIIVELARLADSVPDATAQPDVAASWWRIGRLPASGDWTADLALRDPAVLLEGIALGEMAEIIPGRRPREVFGAPRPGLLPVRKGKSIDGRKPEQWAPAGSAPAVEVGDVLVVEVGLRGRAVVADSEGLAGTGTLLVRPHDKGLSPSIAGHLNSESALGLRASLAGGAFLPRLTPTLLRRMPMPQDALSAHGPHLDRPAPAEAPLAEILERTLWR